MGKKKRPRGQPKKLGDEDARKRLLKLISTTRSLQSACAAVGLNYQTMRNECERDPVFAEQVEQAKAAKIGLLEDLAHEVAKCDPPTLRWLLANLDRENYAHKPEAQQHAQAHVHVIANDPLYLSPEQRRAVLISLMGQPAAALESGSTQSVDGTAANQVIDGTATRSDSPDAAKVLPTSTVAKANGHAGNGKH